VSASVLGVMMIIFFGVSCQRALMNITHTHTPAFISFYDEARHEMYNKRATAAWYEAHSTAAEGGKKSYIHDIKKELGRSRFGRNGD
jgi:hypothetical protein